MSETSPGERARGGVLATFLELGKPRLSGLAVFAVLAGLWLGSPALPAADTVYFATVGTMLAAMGGNALNMYREQEFDARMRRTQGRPLPSGRLTPSQVLGFGVGCCATGIASLAFATNALATAVCASIVLSYVLVYTPLKRVSSLNTLVGAVPGALPPIVGYAAGAGRLDEKALILFLIVFCWQIPHFLAIAWRHREDYRRGGMLMLPVVDPGGRSTSNQMVIYTLALIATSVSARIAGLSGDLYLVAALFLGFGFLVPVCIAAITRREEAMRMTFLTSIIYLPALLSVMVLDRAES